MKLLIAIPALNEEASIESIIVQSLDARDYIVAHSPVTAVEITVISDGSTDRTVERASRFTGAIHLIVFERNRGYGAAIKEAWSQSDADILGFLDADGTCDPRFFASLCQVLHDRGADVALGSRMHSAASMPLIRRLGNFIFASLLAVVSSARVRDSASGMRVVRRDCLSRLYPLPDGLHFTPAMSARCLLSNDIPICEADMPYRERAGRSKLSVVRDGFRFLHVILTTASLYRAWRLMSLLGGLLSLAAAALMIRPVLFYLETRTVAEWMIYRFVVSQLLGTAGVLLFSMSYLVRRIVSITLSGTLPSLNSSARKGYLAAFFEGRIFWFVTVAMIAAGGTLVYPSFQQLVTTGATYEHWSRFVVMSFFVGAAVILWVTRGVGFALDLLQDRVAYLAGVRVGSEIPLAAELPVKR